MNKLKIGFASSQWYIKAGKDRYLCNDGVVRYWKKMDFEKKKKVWFASWTSANNALQKHQNKKKPKLSPSAKKKVNDLIGKVKKVLDEISATVKEIYGPSST